MKIKNVMSISSLMVLAMCLAVCGATGDLSANSAKHPGVQSTSPGNLEIKVIADEKSRRSRSGNLAW